MKTIDLDAGEAAKDNIAGQRRQELGHGLARAAQNKALNARIELCRAHLPQLLLLGAGAPVAEESKKVCTGHLCR